MSPSHKIVNFAEKNLTRLPFVEVDNFLDERRKERRRIDLVLKILKQTLVSWKKIILLSFVEMAPRRFSDRHISENKLEIILA